MERNVTRVQAVDGSEAFDITRPVVPEAGCLRKPELAEAWGDVMSAGGWRMMPTDDKDR